MVALRQIYKDTFDENVALKAEVDKGVEDIAKAVGDGYGHCLARISSAAIDVSGHSFEDYIHDYAASASSLGPESVEPVHP